MAALDFPASPTNGQQFAAPNGVVYQWMATPGTWVPVGGGASGMLLHVGTTPPASPVTNQLWWHSEFGQLYIWYNDGSSTQWVPAAPAVTVTQAWRLIGKVNVTTPVAQVDFTNIPSDINTLMFSAANVLPVSNDVGFGVRFFNAAGAIDAANNYGQSAVLSQTAQAVGAAPPVTAYIGASYTHFCYNAAGNLVSNAHTGISVTGNIAGIRSALQKFVTFSAGYLQGAGTTYDIVQGGGIWLSPSIITGVRFIFGGGNIASGNISLWGAP